MNRSVSVRIDGVLADREREAASQEISSLGGVISSLNVHVELRRTYGLLTLGERCDDTAVARAFAGAQVHSPALVVLEIMPDYVRRLPALAHALGGPGRPVGVRDATSTERSLVVEVDISRTPLALILDLVDIELESAPGRRIVPLLPLDDAALTALARDLLGDPHIDPSRLIETYTEPMLRATL